MGAVDGLERQGVKVSTGERHVAQIAVGVQGDGGAGVEGGGEGVVAVVGLQGAPGVGGRLGVFVSLDEAETSAALVGLDQRGGDVVLPGRTGAVGADAKDVHG